MKTVCFGSKKLNSLAKNSTLIKDVKGWPLRKNIDSSFKYLRKRFEQSVSLIGSYIIFRMSSFKLMLFSDCFVDI